MEGLELQGVSKIFYDNGYETVALHDINLRIERGESIAIIGPSGSGKTTLLNIIGLLEKPTEGKVIIDGTDTAQLKEKEKNTLRNRLFGYIVQDYALIEDDTVYQNIRIPLLYSSDFPRNVHRTKITEIAAELNIDKLLYKKAMKLSGGEKQRVALARALVCNQQYCLADEPTGALDKENKKLVFSLLKRKTIENGKTLVIVTHDEKIADECDRVISLDGGILLPR